MPVGTGKYKNITASGTVYAKPGRLIGFFVNSTSSGTIALTDGGAGGTAITGTITPAAGAWYDLPIAFGTDLYCTKGGTSIDVTFVYTESGA